jgi:hypothetical protein
MTKRSIFASILLARLAMFSFFLASADPEEPERKFTLIVSNCVCISVNGQVIVYAYSGTCHPGGDEPCFNVSCPSPPYGCNDV